eukprot:GHVU01220769.1.p1 GENE.GHVU01220769.1~~GHVU01220769.1.p1  ORF type:complete len:159 (+),score=34.64 GHVU01220769.1:273-749(+)
MALRGRKIMPEVHEIFERYVTNKVTQPRLSRDEAVRMFQVEFGLKEEPAVLLFEHFDADKNKFLSQWEFQHFYTVVGCSAPELVKQFEDMDKNKDGVLDKQEAEEGMRTLKTSEGDDLDEKEIKFFLDTATTDSDDIDLGKFVDLLARLKKYKRPKRK